MKLLFICTHNRCRSILAEAITNQLAGHEIIAASAGSSPQGEVHPLTLHYLVERGVSIVGLQSQSWDQFEGFNPDAVVTLCDSAAQEPCPVWFGKSIQVHWGIADPSKLNASETSQSQRFNQAIDIIERRVSAILDSGVVSLKGEALRAALTKIADQVR